jgi:NAD(P)-dependent dehydrogenase (short-subunit alcohol dehydrogenase family)
VSFYRALITGGGRGIGRGIALALAQRGFAVVVNALERDADVEATLADVRALGVDAEAVIGDVADLVRHEALLDAAGPITTLVNNAGVTVLQRGDLLEATPESFDRCLSVNTRAAFFLTQAWAKRALRLTTDAHRCVITISSSNATAVSISRGEYCVSKAGASMIAKLFAVRLGPEGIGSYEIRPGIIETAMTAQVKETYQRRIAEGLTVAPRMGQPSDIGSIAAALATGQLAFCTGQALEADGGLVIPRL